MTANKLLLAIRQNGGAMSRSEILREVFRRNYPARLLDKWLSAELLNLVEAHKESSAGSKPVTRYSLTTEGWAAANALIPWESMHLNREEVQRQINRLAASGDSWAQMVREAIVSRSQANAIPTKAGAISVLVRLFKESTSPAETRWAKKILRRIDKNLTAGPPPKPKRKRRYDYNVPERLAWLRHEYGDGEPEPPTPKPPNRGPSPQSGLNPGFNPEPEPPAKSEHVQPELSGVPRKVYRFDSGRVYESAKLGGTEIQINERGGRFLDAKGFEVIVIQTEARQGQGIGTLVDDGKRGWWVYADSQPAPAHPLPILTSYDLDSRPDRDGKLVSKCTHPRNEPDPNCMGHCTSPNYWHPWD